MLSRILVYRITVYFGLFVINPTLTGAYIFLCPLAN
jgi:hypothetical protein